MNELLEDLHHIYGNANEQKYCCKEMQRVEEGMKNCKSILSEAQYKQVFEWLNDIEAVTDKMSVLNFASGVKFALDLVGAVNPENFV